MSDRKKRLKASDVFRESDYVFSKKVNFEEAFPEIENLKIIVEESGKGIKSCNKKHIYTKHNFPGEYINCSNPYCYNGGFSIGAILRDMTRKKLTEFETLKLCQGYEASPKGKKTYRNCLNQFKIKVYISYKKKENK
ncbi:MAG: hypothetical protein PWP02_960 [Thermosipho sp. (in: thermotogales)]|jgi:hypothetical protein|nr:hypothetical protein [Petrotoga sp.]MDN5325245.1 hypothetical protein [Thermosipho sp. (in: thermotogales)]